MSSPTEIINLEEAGSRKFFKEIGAPRFGFSQQIILVDDLLVMARNMPPEDFVHGDVHWFYQPGCGDGALYYKDQNGKQAVVFVNNFIAEDGVGDIKQATLRRAVAIWRANLSSKREYMFAALTLPDVWQRQFTHYFFQETKGGVLCLEELGSAENGWFAVQDGGLPINAIVGWGERLVQAEINGSMLETNLDHAMDYGYTGMRWLESLF